MSDVRVVPLCLTLVVAIGLSALTALVADAKGDTATLIGLIVGGGVVFALRDWWMPW